MNSFLKIIDETMTFVLKGETDVLHILRNQYQNSIIKRIDKSPVGCFVEFETINTDKVTSPSNFYIGDVFIESNQVPLGIGVVLFIEKGLISLLEYYTFGDDDFPNKLNDYHFVYGNNGERNFSEYISWFVGKWTHKENKQERVFSFLLL